MVSGAVVEKWMDMNIYLILLMCQLETSQINMNTDLMTVGQPEQVFFEDNVQVYNTNKTPHIWLPYNLKNLPSYYHVFESTYKYNT